MWKVSGILLWRAWCKNVMCLIEEAKLRMAIPSKSVVDRANGQANPIECILHLTIRNAGRLHGHNL